MRVAALLLILATVPPVVAADWSEFGADAARTFAVDDRGPAWGDVAAVVPLLGWTADNYIVRGHYAYVAAHDGGYLELGDERVLLRVDLRDGETTLLARTGIRKTSISFEFTQLAADDDRIYLGLSETFAAFDLEGREVWRWKDPTHPPDSRPIVIGIALVDGRLLVSGVRQTPVQVEGVGCPNAGHASFSHAVAQPTEGYIASLDAATGELLWIARTASMSRAEQAPDQAPFASEAAERRISGFAATPDVVVASVVVGAEPGQLVGVATRSTFLAGLSIEDGALLWQTEPTERRLEAGTWICHQWGPLPGAEATISSPAIGGAAIYAKWEGLTSVNLLTGEVLWTEPLGADDLSPGEGGSPPAVTEDAVVVVTNNTMYRYQRSDHVGVWKLTLAPGESFFYTPTVGAHAAYAGVRDWSENSSAMLAVDLATGKELWRVPGPYWSVLAGDKLVGANDTALFILGAAATSPRLALEATEVYPRAGEAYRVDLSDASAPEGDEVVAYRVEWGDGSDSGWQPSPVLEHAYPEEGEFAGRAHVQTAQGRTTSVPFVARVGEPEPNVLSKAFAPENQDSTFFLLGLVATGAGGAFGLLRVQRRRKRLAQEIAAVDARLASAGSDPNAIDHALDERRVHARALLLGGRLNEGQHAVLLAHIDEASRHRRLAMVQREFDFLPHRHVRALQEMLQDGRISSLERAHYLGMLEADATLTPEYKARVRAVVEAWGAHDAPRS